MPKEHMSASESIWAPNGLETPSLRARAPSRPSKTTQAMRHRAAQLTLAWLIARKIAETPSIRLLTVHALTSTNRSFRANVGPRGRSGRLSAAGSAGTAVTGADDGTAGTARTHRRG